MTKTEAQYSMEMSALFAKFMRAYLECSDEVQTIIREMSIIVASPGADDQEREMALATLAEALFPEYDGGALGIDLQEADKACIENSPDGAEAKAELDREEATFAERLRSHMERVQISQVDLAERAGVGQPAISMMLKRECRPQRRTVLKLAEALGVGPDELWPLR